MEKGGNAMGMFLDHGGVLNTELIGWESEPVKIHINYDEVVNFAAVIGQSELGVIPPTYPGVLMKGEIGGLSPTCSGMIHGEQKFIYYQPLSIGETLTVRRKIKDICCKNGKAGRMVFLVLETNGYGIEGELKFTSSSVLIVPQEVYKNETE